MLPIEKLLISPIFLMGILGLTIFIGWLFAVKIFTPQEKFWRISNFIGLLFTCFGILGIVKDSRQIFFEREFYRKQSMIEGQYKWRLLSNLNEDYYCHEFIETVYSPSNLDSIQEDYHTTCNWIKDNKTYLAQCYYQQVLIDQDSINYPILQTTDQILMNYFGDLKQCIIDYNNDIHELKEYERGQRPNTFELFYIIFSPLFLSIGLGWEFVKFIAKR